MTILSFEVEGTSCMKERENISFALETLRIAFQNQDRGKKKEIPKSWPQVVAFLLNSSLHVE